MRTTTSIAEFVGEGSWATSPFYAVLAPPERSAIIGEVPASDEPYLCPRIAYGRGRAQKRLTPKSLRATAEASSTAARYSSSLDAQEAA